MMKGGVQESPQMTHLASAKNKPSEATSAGVRDPAVSPASAVNSWSDWRFFESGVHRSFMACQSEMRQGLL